MLERMNRKERRRREKLDPFSHAFTIHPDNRGMSLTLGPKQEERLRKRAKRKGTTLEAYLEKVMNDAIAPARAENARAKGLPPPTEPMKFGASRLHVPVTSDGTMTPEALAEAAMAAALRDEAT